MTHKVLQYKSEHKPPVFNFRPGLSGAFVPVPKEEGFLFLPLKSRVSRTLYDLHCLYFLA